MKNKWTEQIKSFAQDLSKIDLVDEDIMLILYHWRRPNANRLKLCQNWHISRSMMYKWDEREVNDLPFHVSMGSPPLLSLESRKAVEQLAIDKPKEDSGAKPGTIKDKIIVELRKSAGDRGQAYGKHFRTAKCGV